MILKSKRTIRNSAPIQNKVETEEVTEEPTNIIEVPVIEEIITDNAVEIPIPAIIPIVEEVEEVVVEKPKPTKPLKPLKAFITCPVCGLKMKSDNLIFIMNVANHRLSSDNDNAYIKQRPNYKLVACPKDECGVTFVIDKHYKIRGF